MDRFRNRQWAQGEVSPSPTITAPDGTAVRSSSTAPRGSSQGLATRAPTVPDFRLREPGAVNGSAVMKNNVSKGTSRGVSSSGQLQPAPEPANSFFHTGQQQHHGTSTPSGNTQLRLFNRVNNKAFDGGGNSGRRGGDGSGARAQEEPSPSSTTQVDAPFSQTDAPSDSSSSSFPPSCSPSPPAAATVSSSSEPSFAFPSPPPPLPSQFRPSSLSTSATSATSTTSPFSLPSGASVVDSSVAGPQFVLPDAGMECASGRDEIREINSSHSNHNAAERTGITRGGGADCYRRQQGRFFPPSSSPSISMDPSPSPPPPSSSGRPSVSSSSGAGKKRTSAPQPRTTSLSDKREGGSTSSFSTPSTNTARGGSLKAALGRHMTSPGSSLPLDTIMEDHDPFDDLSSAEDTAFATAVVSTQKIRYRQLAVREGFARSHARLLQRDTGFKIQDDVDRLLDCTRSLLDDMGMAEDTPAATPATAAMEEDAEVFGQQETQDPLNEEEAVALEQEAPDRPLLLRAGASVPLAVVGGKGCFGGGDSRRSSTTAAIKPPSKVTITSGGEVIARDAMDVSGLVD